MSDSVLGRKVIYKHKSGSQLYGTNTPKSDTDYDSVFLPRSEDILSLQSCEMIDNSTKSSSEDRRNTSEDIDDHCYSLPRYLDLALHSNPAMTELLFSNNPEIEDPRFLELKYNYEKIVSIHCYDSFTGFAISQKKKLQYKSLRYGQLSKSLEYLNNKFTNDQLIDSKSIMDLDTANWLNNNLSEYKGKKNNRESFHQGLPLAVIYEKISAEYNNYGWRVHTDTFETLGYDVKFGSHAIRLMHEGAEILTKGYLEFPITGQSLTDIMSVRNAEVSIDEFYELFHKYEEANRTARANSKLREKADWKWANKWITNILRDSIISGEI
jgi:predicted nucleotidyltransferase